MPFVPNQLYRRHVAARRKFPRDGGPPRISFRIDRPRLGGDGRRILKFESHERHVGGVTGHVTQSAGAEIPPATPGERMISRLYFTLLIWGINRIGALGGSPQEK